LAELIRNLHDAVINEKLQPKTVHTFFAGLPAFAKDCS